MRTIATLGPSTRLVVFQLLMRNELVPKAIPPKSADTTPSPAIPRVSGIKVLDSTSGLDIFPLAVKIACAGNYELVDAWVKPHETNWKMSFVRFVYCHKDSVKRDELFPAFVAQRDQLDGIFSDLVGKNMWAAQAHLNPYFENDGSASSDKVLMIGCAGRLPDTQVFQGGRDENNRGVGPKVLMSTLAPKLDLKTGSVVLTFPEPIPVPAS